MPDRLNRQVGTGEGITPWKDFDANESATLYLEALRDEADTRLALKRARAAAFVELMKKPSTNPQRAWQVIGTDPEIQELEDDYESARIDLLVMQEVHKMLHAGLYAYSDHGDENGSGEEG